MENLTILQEENGNGNNAAKVRDCNHCGTSYPFTFSSSKFCSDKCRVAASAKNKKLNAGSENTNEAEPTVAITKQQKQELPSLPPAAQYIINHQEKEIARWEKKYNDERAERKVLKDKYEALKADQLEATHKQALQGIENAAPSFFEKLITQLPPALVEKLGDKVLGFIPDAQPAIAGQLDGEAGTWLNGIIQWFSSLPKPSQTVAAGLIGELTKVAPDQLEDVIKRMVNILQNGTTIEKPKQQRAAYGGI